MSRPDCTSTHEAKDVVDTYDWPLADWNVHHVLRLINSFDSELFEKVKDRCVGLDLKGTGTLINRRCIYLVFDVYSMPCTPESDS